MLENLTEKLREFSGNCRCISCGTEGHRREMLELHDGPICRHCLTERVLKAQEAIHSLGLKGRAPNDVCLLRQGRRLFGGPYNLEHVIEYDHRYICEHCGHFGAKKSRRIVYNSGQFINSPTTDICDDCGSSNIWYIDVADSDITGTYNHSSNSVFSDKSRA